MKGIKFLDKEMKAVNGDGMTYELGKTYKTEDEIKLRHRGYHFCNSVKDCCIYYYSISNFRVFDIESGDVVIADDDLYCTNEITLVREWSKEEIVKYIEDNKLIESKDWGIRLAVANQGYSLDKLVNDKNWRVRSAVAKQGYGLDKLVNDHYWIVREAVAEQGYGLDKLVNDKDWYMRAAVAEQGYGLDKLVNDEDWRVRLAVANQSYGLDILVNDENWRVRETVAEQGYKSK